MLKHNLRELRNWDRTHVWHAFTQMAEYEPLVIERAEGCVLVDIDGNRYIDGVSSLWCNIHGHRHPKIDAAIRAQLDKVAHVTNLGSSNPTTILLAKRLAEIAPPGLRHVFFSDDGATAVEVAIKMAFQYWRQRPEARPEKTCYLALGEAYHGDTLGSVSVGGVERFHAMFRPLLFETLRVPAPDRHHRPPDVAEESVCQYHLEKLEQVLAQHHGRIAAMVIERAEGCVLVDIDGNRYIDGVSSLWCNIHGHRHPKIDAADAHAAQRVAVIGLAEGQVAGLFRPVRSPGFSRAPSRRRRLRATG